MNETLDAATKQAGDGIIAISDNLGDAIERWSDLSTRPEDLSVTECAGFISKDAATGPSMVVDVRADDDATQGILRLWAITSKPDEAGIERFDNVQLDFAADYAVARAASEKAAAISYDDIKTVLHDAGTHIVRIVVSNQTGLNPETGQPLGQRFDLSAAEFEHYEGSTDEIVTAINQVVTTVQAA